MISTTACKSCIFSSSFVLLLSFVCVSAPVYVDEISVCAWRVGEGRCNPCCRSLRSIRSCRPNSPPLRHFAQRNSTTQPSYPSGCSASHIEPRIINRPHPLFSSNNSKSFLLVPKINLQRIRAPRQNPILDLRQPIQRLLAETQMILDDLIRCEAQPLSDGDVVVDRCLQDL